MIKNNKTILSIILLGFILSVALTVNNLKKYDKNILSDEGLTYHQMIKFDAYRYATHGNDIKNQLKDGVNFFKTGREHYTKYLPPRIMAAYYYFFDIELVDDIDERKVNTGIHFPYLVMQSLVYYLSVFFLYLVISKTFNQRVSLFISIFLCYEPTIFQYHSSFWSESLFFSFQILLIALIFKKKHSHLNFFIIGIFLTLLSFQKEYAIFYIIPIIVFFLVTLDKSKYQKFIFLLIGFFLTQSCLLYNNYQRSGELYIMTADSKINLHIDLVKKVIKQKFNISGKKFDAIEGIAARDWIKKNSVYLIINDNTVKFDNNTSFMDYRSNISEKDKIKFDNFIRNRSLKYFYDYPLDFIKFVIKSSLHITLLNPFHIYSDNNFTSGEDYYLTSTHDKLVPYRIIYTLFIYLICLYGIILLIRKKEYNILLYLFLSISYFYFLVSWHGNTRYFTPVIIYLSFLFGYSLDNFFTSKKTVN